MRNSHNESFVPSLQLSGSGGEHMSILKAVLFPLGLLGFLAIGALFAISAMLAGVDQ